MFTLTADELDNAFEAIKHHGYSTMLPDPPEWVTVTNNWIAVRSVLEKIDLDLYDPFKPMQVFAPKSRANVRVIHLLHPQDLLIYTALVLLVKNGIEVNRTLGRLKRVFSYRADLRKPQELYGARGSYEGYRGQLEAKASKTGVKYVAIADIADFYPRIYQHRLENVIESIASTQREREVARVLVKKLIGNLMGKNSYGIPVGPYASRLLGEATLIDVDAFLQSQGIDFVRWVDDYNIFCRSEYEAQSALFRLGEWLFSNHGLTLQSAKTQILPVRRYRRDVLVHHDEALTDRDTVVNLLRDFQLSYDEEDDDDEPNEQKVEDALALLQSKDLKGMLKRSLADTSLVDYEAVTYVLTKLPRIPGAPAVLKKEVLSLIIDNAALLYPVAEHIATYVLSLDNLKSSEQKTIAAKLLKPLKSKRNPPPTYYAMWILHIFASSCEWNHARDIAAMYLSTNSEVVKRHAALAIHASGKRSEALAIKGDYTNASPLLKLAILCASRKLGSDERKHWKIANGVSGCIEKLL